jgi:maltose/moltooligosaccharide transporter
MRWPRRPTHAAYNPAVRADQSQSVDGRKEFYGQKAGEVALTATVEHLTSDRVRRIDQRLVAGDPAQALLDTAGNNPANLIVVGNRGLGAAEGQMLGSIPAAVVKDAVCDVLDRAGQAGYQPKGPGLAPQHNSLSPELTAW